MTTEKAGKAAKAGFYFNTRSWDIELNRVNGEALPGNADDRYVRIPAVALLILGPAMGFLFVIFLPFIGFALLFREIGHKLLGWLPRRGNKLTPAKTTGR